MNLKFVLENRVGCGRGSSKGSEPSCLTYWVSRCGSWLVRFVAGWQVTIKVRPWVWYMQTQEYIDWVAETAGAPAGQAGSDDGGGAEDWSGSSNLDQLADNDGDDFVVLVATHDGEQGQGSQAAPRSRGQGCGGAKKSREALSHVGESISGSQILASCLEDVVETSRFVHAQVWRYLPEHRLLSYRS